ncbi:MAG: DUF5063 domain-containing protein [Microbacter sp.]
MMGTTILEKDRLEFITVAAEYCIFVENAASSEKKTFIEQAIKYLSTLYLKTALLPVVYDEEVSDSERMVSEVEYEAVRTSLEELLGMDDAYLTVFHPDMQFSDLPVSASIAEDLADIFQELKDFLFNCQLGDEALVQSGLMACLNGFHQHWGRKLLNALSALHQLFHGEELMENEADLPPMDIPQKTSRKDSFLQHQLRDDDVDL